jgi:hypothetical protein
MVTLATDLATGLDPVLLARQAGLEPDPWQAAVLRSASPRLLLNCCRQSGKSTITALLGLWTALYQPPALILLLSPSERQSVELLKTVMRFYTALGPPVPADAESTLRLELQNGSRILALPGKDATIRGYAGVRLLVIDEAARVDDDLYHSVRPMLGVSGGRLVAMSTPWGRRGWWHAAWEQGADWQRVQLVAEQCLRLSAAFLASERAAMPHWVYQQEYEGEFAEVEGAAFRYQDIEAALSAEVQPLWA